MLINGKHDDIGAIVNTAINEYNAFFYIICAIVISVILTGFLLKVLSISTRKYSINNVISTKWYPKKKLAQWLTGIGLVIVFSLIFVVFRFCESFIKSCTARITTNGLDFFM